MKGWESKLALPFSFFSLDDFQIWWAMLSWRSQRFSSLLCFGVKPSLHIYLDWRTRQGTHETRHSKRTSCRARLHVWHQCLCLNSVEPGFPGPDSPCPLLFVCVEALEHWQINICFVCRGLGAWPTKLAVVLVFFFHRQMYLEGFVYSSCYQQLWFLKLSYGFIGVDNLWFSCAVACLLFDSSQELTKSRVNSLLGWEPWKGKFRLIWEILHALCCFLCWVCSIAEGSLLLGGLCLVRSKETA